MTQVFRTIPTDRVSPWGSFARGAWVFAVVIATVGGGGCAQWKDEPAAELSRGGLPAAQISDEVAILEVAFVRIPEPPLASSEASAAVELVADRAGEAASTEPVTIVEPEIPVQHETPAEPEISRRAETPADPAEPPRPVMFPTRSLGERLDETVVPGEMRERLAANGIRVGRLLSIEPHQLGQLAPVDESTRLMEEAGVVSDFEQRRRQISCRDGQPYTLAVRRPSGENVSTLIRTAEGVVGKSLSDPQFMLILRTRQMDDGRLAVRLTPEIQHGEIRQHYVSSDLAIRMEFQREQWTLHELMCEVPLSEGQAVVLMPLEEAFGLGKKMFVGKRADLSQERIAVVLRLQRRPRHRIGS